MRRSVPRLFADVTALLEDMHGIAVEGQAPGNSPDAHLALARALRSGIVEADRIAVAIALAAGRRMR